MVIVDTGYTVATGIDGVLDLVELRFFL